MEGKIGVLASSHEQSELLVPSSALKQTDHPIACVWPMIVLSSNENVSTPPKRRWSCLHARSFVAVLVQVTTEAPFTGEIEDDIFSDIYTFGGRCDLIHDREGGGGGSSWTPMF